jgi:flagellum-specific ATP synthase
MSTVRLQTDIERRLDDLVAPPPRRSGTVVRAVGLRMEARGIHAPLGAICEIRGQSGQRLEAEVVGFDGETLLLMPYAEAQGIAPGAQVVLLTARAQAWVGDGLLGRVIDGRGAPLDGKAAAQGLEAISLQGQLLNPMERAPIRETLDVGVRSINAMLTVGRGQRLGLIAGSGVGKSVLLGMMTRFTEADVVVIGLIGERGREVQHFIQESLGEAGLARAVIVAAPANVSPVLRLKATMLTHAVAEYFRDQGRHVLMLLDSLTRVAHAQREVGLAIGEPPTAKGYPPSVFALLPSLIERGGVGREGRGSISAIYTVLAEGDDSTDPIVDIARASLDGQVMLSRRLADAAIYPAIDLTGSISRVMHQIVPTGALAQANRFRQLWSLYQQNQDLISVGAYEVGTNRDIDLAIRLRPKMEQLLRQGMHERASLGQSVQAVEQLMSGAREGA